MQQADWQCFAAKFSGRERTTFEWLCNLLFSIEHNRPLGIARYENHAGIETEPIQVGEEWVGWQAKYYTTPLADHKDALINAIDKAKTRHPNLTQIIFYTNRDFGQDNKKTEPKYKTDIESHGVAKGVKVLWKPGYFFDSSFVTIDNAQIVKYFFSFDKSIIDFMGELEQHAESVLSPVKSKIAFNGTEVKINRAKITESLKEAINDRLPIILSGEGGVGKTAVVKDLYQDSKKEFPLFIFKATEFNHLRDANELFVPFGIKDFCEAYPDVTTKCVVVDSAEKLSDIDDKDVFKEFIDKVLASGWKIIFTSRRSYLDDLKVMLVDAFGVGFHSLDIPKLTQKELDRLSSISAFDLPKSSRMQDLIANPFYLNEYLQNYESLTTDVTYSDFKNLLWDKQIAKSSYKKDAVHTRREDCFMEIAKRRADKGNFTVEAKDLDQGILQRLVADEIIGFDTKVRGYFISHDIYEEWALEKIIEVAFNRSENTQMFFSSIGDSLPIRRSFRHWLSDKLVTSKDEVKQLVETCISDKEIASHWRDEVLISVLLSEHAKQFIELIEDGLLADDAKLLIRLTFLLRVACKQVDETMIKRLGLIRTGGVAVETLFTAPKGSGWDYVIEFIYKKKDILGLKNSGAIIALLYDWNQKHSSGATTKYASLTALFQYESIKKEYGFRHGDRGYQSKILRVILSGSTEIRPQLTEIIDKVVASGTFNHQHEDHELIEAMLGPLVYSSEVAAAIPEKILELAKSVWFRLPNDEDRRFGRSGMDIEEDFGVSVAHHDYYPSSTLQTPLATLLMVAPQQTVNFIINVVNTAAEVYANSEMGSRETHEVQVHISDKEKVSQYISSRLWEMYRGTHVNPNLLESIHMNLEKWLLDLAKRASKENIEKWCIYLLKNSRSASITAVVASVVISEPYKLFEVARILFATKAFFEYDSVRYQKDRDYKNQLEMLSKMGSHDFMVELCQDERIKAADDKHRKNYLENLVVYYQFFRVDNEPIKNVKYRQKIVWQILDDYYKKLPDPANETERDKTQRIFLARTDRRKMHPTAEEKDGQTLISFNPELEPGLKKFSDDALKQNEEAMKYLPLMLWSKMRWKKEEEKYKDYPQFESDPKEVIAQVKAIFEKLRSGSSDADIFDRSAPAYACAVLVRDFRASLNKADQKLCRDVLLDYVALTFSDEYDYQIGDGVEAAIGAMPLIFGQNKKADELIKTFLILLLFDRSPVGMSQSLSDYVVVAILHTFWKINPRDADSLLWGYLVLRPKFDEMWAQQRADNIKNRVYQVSKTQLIEQFTEKYKAELEKIIANSISFVDIPEVAKSDLEVLQVAFELIPYRTKDKDHKKFLAAVFPIFAQSIFTDDRHNDRFVNDFGFMEKLTHFILTSTQDEIKVYIKPFVEAFAPSDAAGELIEAFISAEDKIANYEEFWIVWNSFYDPILKLSNESYHRHDTKNIVRNYLLAWRFWKETAREWHSLKAREAAFYKKATAEMGMPITLLYSIAKILYDIGSPLVEDGIFWVSDLLDRNQSLSTDELEVNTVYHLERVMRRYILASRQQIKSTPSIKKSVVCILDFLIEKGSVTAYILREDIL